MANNKHQVFAVGKKVYWIDHQKFLNDKNQRNGYQKAVDYCLYKSINPQEIIQFDSETECDYYEYLLAQQCEGKISNLTHHFLLLVQNDFTNSNGDNIPAITYNADFVYKDLTTGKRVVVDVKSSEYFLNNDGGRFILLKSVFDRVYKDKDLYIKIVIKRGKNEFYEWHIGDKQKSGKLIKKQSSEIKELRKKLHEQEVADRKAEREKARLIELRGKPNLTKAQKKRLEELEGKYSL